MPSSLRFRTLIIVAVWILVLVVPAGADVGAVFDSLARQAKSGEAQVRTLTDNVESWYARWKVLDMAKESIDSTYFIVETDIFGRAFVGKLLQKAQEGVQIRLMIDARGTKSLARMSLGRDYLQELMQHEGVTIKVYNPLHKGLLALPRGIRQPIASNHDKLLIVDGEWVVTGGRNISANYFVSRDDMPKAYRDTDILMRGKQIASEARQAFEVEFAELRNADVHKDFFGNWTSQSLRLEVARRAMNAFLLANDLESPDLDGKLAKYYETDMEELRKFPKMKGFAAYDPFHGERSYPSLILDKTSAVSDQNGITENLVKFFDAAESEIVIQNPYVVITKTAMAAMKRASDRGVKLFLLTNSPDSTDSLLTQALFIKEWKHLLKDVPNLRIFAYKGPGKIHAKVFVFDRMVTMIGTYNMDPMSERINSEEIAVVKSGPVGLRNRLRIGDDAKNAVEYRIKIGANGEPEQVVGPSDHAKAAAIEAVERVQLLSFLRPLI